MKYGYARVSSKEQDLTIQLDLLKQAGCDMIRSEKISAKTLDARHRGCGKIRWHAKSDHRG